MTITETKLILNKPERVRLEPVDDTLITICEGSAGAYEPLKHAQTIYRELANIGGQSGKGGRPLLQFIEKYGLLGGDRTVKESTLAKAVGVTAQDQESFNRPISFQYSVEYPDASFSDMCESWFYEIEVADEFYKLVTLHDAIKSPPGKRQKALSEIFENKPSYRQDGESIYFLDELLPLVDCAEIKNHPRYQTFGAYVLARRINNWFQVHGRLSPTLKASGHNFREGVLRPTRLIDALYLGLYQDITGGYPSRNCSYCGKPFTPDRGNRIFCLPPEGKAESVCSINYRRRLSYLKNDKEPRVRKRYGVNSPQHKAVLEEIKQWEHKKPTDKESTS